MNYQLDYVEKGDIAAWIDTKKICYKEYVDQYYGGWVDEVQARMNAASFEKARQMTFFRKIVVDGKLAGFLGYDVKTDCIDSITIHMYESARNHGIGSDFLRNIVNLSNSSGRPARLKVFRSNRARFLYERFGFQICGESDSHYFMQYTPEDGN